MNCLHLDPTLLRMKLDIKRRDFNYTCFDNLNEYNIQIIIYYDYFLSNEEFKLKNLWNHMIQKWNLMKTELKDNSDFIESNYYQGNYHRIHENMNDDYFNKLLSNFIEDSQFKSLFICNCIQNYIYPI